MVSCPLSHWFSLFWKGILLPTSEQRLPQSRPLPLRGHEPVSSQGGVADPIAITLSYHHQTKHHLDRYARSPGYLDWANQPDPFRTFQGAKRIELPLAADGLATPYADLYIPLAIKPCPLDLGPLAMFFELAFGLSAWKEYQGNRWALRCNPSSGNLHPTEAYTIAPPLPHLEAGVYHYVSRDHCLEQRCHLEGSAAADFGNALPVGSFLVGLSSIQWREAWKYGERAFRYCQHDIGHAIATVRYAAAALGWSARLLDSFSDDDVAALLGIDRGADFAEVEPHGREHPDGLILVSREPVSPPPLVLPVDSIRASRWTGQANKLSALHVTWDVIDAVTGATRKPATALAPPVQPTVLPPLVSDSSAPASTLIRQRRSCLALDGESSISGETFYRMLDHLLPRPDVPPWDTLPWAPHLHCGIFVHRITGLAPGLYLFERDQRVHERLQAALRPTFVWQPPAGCPEHLRLFCLMRGDLRRIAQTVSCDQEIAADGAFSLGMIADFASSIRAKGAWWYRGLFWEAGVLGQVLYLEAEAAGVRSTGIGCYFDDTFHELLGLTGEEFQDLYHFTVGGPVEDPRLMTHPPYAHLRRPRTL